MLIFRCKNIYIYFYHIALKVDNFSVKFIYRYTLFFQIIRKGDKKVTLILRKMYRHLSKPFPD